MWIAGRGWGRELVAEAGDRVARVQLGRIDLGVVFQSTVSWEPPLSRGMPRTGVASFVLKVVVFRGVGLHVSSGASTCLLEVQLQTWRTG